MSKKAKKIDVIIMIMIPLMFILVIIISNIRGHPYIHEWTIMVDKDTELSVTIHDVQLDHANFLFNDSIYFDIGNLRNHSNEIDEIWQMKTPFTLQKKAGSDTMTITSPHYDTRYLILE